MTFFQGGEAVYNTVHANNFEFFVELNRVIQREPDDFLIPRFVAWLQASVWKSPSILHR